MRKTIYIFFFILGCFGTGSALLCSCAGGKKAVAGDPRYSRQPVVEVTEEQLKADGELIDATMQGLLGNRTEAVEHYRALLRQQPANAAACYGLGRVYLQSGWLDSALYFTKRAHHLDGKNTWYLVQLSQIYEKQHDGKHYVDTWEDIVKLNPDEVDYYYNLSNAYLMSNDVLGSIEVLDRVEKRYGVSETVSLQKQKLWNAINMPAKARRELEKLSAAMPNEPRYSAILAESYMSEKNYGKALQYYNAILSANPTDEDIHISLASCHMAMGDMRQAFEHLRQGVALQSIDCRTRLLYITNFMMNKTFFAAYSQPCFLLADSVAQSCPKGSGQDYLYGQILASQGRYAEAAERFLAYVEVEKNEYDAWEALLVCESTLGDRVDLLMAHAEEATELFPFHARPYMVLAQCYLDKGDCENAQQNIKRCQMFASNDPTVNQLKQKISQLCTNSAE